MAKCLMCEQKKGKRYCHREEGDICSACCGGNRTEQLCAPCEFYKSEQSQRRYTTVSKYGSEQMSSDFELQSLANDIEGVFCHWDSEASNSLRDSDVLTVMQFVFDIECFGDDPKTKSAADNLLPGIGMIADRLGYLFGQYSKDKVLMVLGAVYFVAQRRSKGGREYIDFVHQYVGSSPMPGVRVL